MAKLLDRYPRRDLGWLDLSMDGLPDEHGED